MLLKSRWCKSMTALALEQFHRIFDPPEGRVRPLRSTLLAEEHKEVQEALASGNRKLLAKELADLVYVAYGTALVFDIDLDIALGIVHDSNMSKLGEDGKPIFREDGKVLKGPNYISPDMDKALL